MRVIQTYVGKTVFLAIAATSFGLTALLTTFSFIEQIDDISATYTLTQAIAFEAYSLPRMFCDSLPYALLIGSMAGLGILASSSELIVIRTTGVSAVEIAWFAIRPALLFIFVSVLISELVLPGFEREARLIREMGVDILTPGGGLWYKEDSRHVHISAIDPDGTLRDVRHYYSSDLKSITRIDWAKRADFVEGDPGYFQMSDVVSTNFLESRVEMKHLESLRWETGLTPTNIKTDILLEPERMSIQQLVDKISQLSTQHVNVDRLRLGLWSKILSPLGDLVLVFLGLSFVFGPLLEATMGLRLVAGISIAILLRLLYAVLSPMSLLFGLHPALAEIVPILICLGLGFYLFRRVT